MNTRISHLLQNPFEVGNEDIALLQDEIEKYPYFATLRTLLLFGLKELDHDTYQEELKKTSIHSPSRVALYHYLQREKQTSTVDDKTANIEETATSVIEKVEVEKEIQKEETELIQPEERIENQVEKEEEVQEEINTTSSEHTFSEWLSLSKSNSEEPEKTPSEKDIKYQLIDEFIEKSPKISPVNKTQEPNPVLKKSEISNEFSDLMTETLAQIYAEQKKYDKAIRAYKILSLKYPDKKEIFEDKIEEIENLIDSK